jgi:hypothetical protein
MYVTYYNASVVVAVVVKLASVGLVPGEYILYMLYTDICSCQLFYLTISTSFNI